MSYCCPCHVAASVPVLRMVIWQSNSAARTTVDKSARSAFTRIYHSQGVEQHDLLRAEHSQHTAEEASSVSCCAGGSGHGQGQPGGCGTVREVKIILFLDQIQNGAKIILHRNEDNSFTAVGPCGTRLAIASLPPCGHQHSHFAIRTGAAAQLSRLFSGFRRLPVSQLQVVQLLPLCDSSHQNCFTCVL